jgi:pimeloyl-ACP methyl ester carboxylesterase
VHATGFCKEVWEPVVAAGLVGLDVVALDQRGHGQSEEPPIPFDWWDLGRDVLSVLDHVSVPTAVGVGHSSGGAALVMAEVLRPGTFDALVLVEPIVFPGPPMRHEASPLAAGAERRRSTFPSREAAREAYRGRGPFALWDDRVLDAYVEGGLRDRADGGVELRCRPAFEAECYRSGTAHGAWARLGEVRCPALVVAGSESDTHRPELLEGQAAALGGAAIVVIDGATHFLPMERPETIAEIVADAIERVQAGW